MYSFIITQGDRIIQAWQTEWNSYVEDLDDKTRITRLISDEDYDMIIKNLAEYAYKNGKIVKKSALEISTQSQPSEVDQLKEKVETLEKEVSELKKNAKNTK